jgi:hypothetical protein
VARSIRAFTSSGLEYTAIDTMADSQLMRALAGKEIPENSARYKELSQRFPPMVVDLKKKGMTLQWWLAWDRGDGFSRLHFQGWLPFSFLKRAGISLD